MPQRSASVLVLCLILVACSPTGQQNGSKNDPNANVSGLAGTLLDVTKVDEVRAQEAGRQIGFHCGVALQLSKVSLATRTFCTEMWGNADSTRAEYVHTMLTSLNRYCGIGQASTTATGTNAFLLKAGSAPSGNSAETIAAELDELLGLEEEGVVVPSSPSPSQLQMMPSQSDLMQQMFCANIMPFLYPDRFIPAGVTQPTPGQPLPTKPPR